MSWQVLLCFFGSVTCNVLSQNNVVGKVTQSDGSPVEYFTVRFLADTTSITSGSFIGGQFSAVVPTNVNVVEISAWGFESERRILKATGDTLYFSLVNHQHELDEVNVVASKKNLTVDGTTFTLAVEGTSLAELANINDVLYRVPMLMVNENNEVSMFGKDNVVVYVNNRRIKDKKELNSLNPQTVKEVKLISSPEARYDADADAVISITTKDYNGTEVTLRNTATKGRLFSDAANAMLNMRIGATNIHADYTFTASNDKSFEGSSIANISDKQEYDDGGKTESKYIDHSYSIVGEHTFSNDNRLSLQFVGWNDRGTPKVDACQEYFNNQDSSFVVTHRKTADDADHYDIGAAYDFKLDEKSGISVSANSTIHRVATNSDIIENLQSHNYDFDSKYYAFDAQVDYQFSAVNKLGIEAGGKVSVVSNESKSAFCSGNKELGALFSYEYKFVERILGAYLNLDKTIGFLDVNSGLRVEYTDFDGDHNRNNVVDTTYFTFAPNFKLTLNLDDINKWSLAYRSNISRPSFNNLSPSIRYDNAFYYRRGNPSLLPTITSNIILSWNKGSKFWMNIGYRHKRNATIYQYSEVDGGNAIEAILSNHRHMHFILASAGYSFSKGRFQSSNSISVTKPFAKVRLYNGVYKIDRCAYYFKTINDYKINKHFTVNADFIYNDFGETLLERKEAMYNLSVGATVFLLDRCLAFSFVANDILDSYTFKDHREFGSYKVDHRYDPDNTYVRLTMRYQFRYGKTKKIKSVDINSQTVERM
ncbi:MAG: outer membrane beta-barrel family protein [Bacteroidales bacterium]|nr:outer membrane beta-barrel family protein [Bacteroidales bacterium]